MMSESSGSEGKISPELIDEVQRSGRMVFLQTAGYTTAQIAGFGDLVKLPEEKIRELLQRKTEKAIANLLGEATLKHHPKIRKLHEKKRKRR
jgi:hypothetical protein